MIFIVTFILGTLSMWVFSRPLYTTFGYRSIAASTPLPTWENVLYHFIAIYPVFSYLVLIAADRFIFKETHYTHAAVRQQFSIYVFIHILLCILSMVAIRHLLQKSKWYYIPAVIACLTGGLYVTGGFVLMITNK